MPLTLDRLRQLLKYDQETGALTWIARPHEAAFKVRVGSEAGTLHRAGYRQIQIDRKIHKSHRLAWALHYGEWPERGVDHKNGVAADNRIANLRLATPSQNGANSRQRRPNPRHLKGVAFHRTSGLWRAEITKNYKCTSLGYYRTEQQAHEAYVAAAQRIHGEFAHPGRGE